MQTMRMMQKVKMPFSPGFGKKTVKIGKAIGSSSPSPSAPNSSIFPQEICLVFNFCPLSAHGFLSIESMTNQPF
jgi:hypothetical protein